MLQTRKPIYVLVLSCLDYLLVLNDFNCQNGGFCGVAECCSVRTAPEMPAPTGAVLLPELCSS